MALPASAAAHSRAAAAAECRAAIDRYFLHDCRAYSSKPQQPRAASEWDRQTNERTPYTNNVGLPSTYTVNLIYSLNLLTTARPIPFDHWSALYTEKIHALFPSLFTVFG